MGQQLEKDVGSGEMCSFACLFVLSMFTASSSKGPGEERAAEIRKKRIINK